jgi:hypothetical protein
LLPDPSIPVAEDLRIVGRLDPARGIAQDDVAVVKLAEHLPDDEDEAGMIRRRDGPGTIGPLSAYVGLFWMDRMFPAGSLSKTQATVLR